MQDLNNQALTAEEAAVILGDMLRRDLARIVHDKDTAQIRTDQIIDRPIGAPNAGPTASVAWRYAAQ
ncbi:hypothetical protein CLV78_1118 [Aliiruegeria haliotis]|uniref:Uncharacterized protein n=1 Tax=Aliiruegeria haliotis TaxID=1280846 RepID=A0A2T0RI55_9RHOB|nr:hypothetical protein [Aliiruegeria haliotis]PRY20855.1 hypothetical protein CLV78_1118 [Aliiruegeria haliotis]